MPSTKDETLQRIQQEIKECVQREEELRKGYAQLYDNNNVNGATSNPPLMRAQSTSVLNVEHIGDAKSNGHHGSSRRFAQNPTAKGVMQRFIKSRGRLSMSQLNTGNHNNNSVSPTWAPNDLTFEPPKVSAEQGKRLRNGYIPVEERMKQELQEFSKREHELRNERRKSQPDLMALIEQNPPVEETNGLRPAKSMAQLYDSEEFSDETCSAPSSLKQARSLADLCDALDEELSTPGTHYLIKQFENMKKKKEQART